MWGPLLIVKFTLSTKSCHKVLKISFYTPEVNLFFHLFIYFWYIIMTLREIGGGGIFYAEITGMQRSALTETQFSIKECMQSE